MELYNLMEDEVIKVIESMKNDIPDICYCDKCKLDMAAIALNNLSPKYVVTDTGYVYAKANNFNTQFNTDILTAITKAIGIVGKNPRHK
ncbi:late competence development ComFB family protein [Tissierella pigra]|uniref:Competence protein ComFB n=1 Tax=Tissierella pigra TaxID=2607614 RepID=A0A6N7XTL7_9FIRM|nr:late competence development ComFB family protein [Tissierella pigra]MBU5426676.1 late competence development ComFB family protein [Tissierella pigra]MST99883.1 competence protein ComFB [Tissierella pigra]